jgi:hypothetical protein
MNDGSRPDERAAPSVISSDGDRGDGSAPMFVRGDHLHFARLLLDSSADVILTVVSEAERIHEHRLVDADLREDVLRVTAQALAEGRVSEAEAATIREELDDVHPAAVLETWWRQIIPRLDRPTLGAFMRRDLDDAA